MYEQFFGLSEKPFSIQPDPSFLYWGRTHRLAYAMLEYGVLNHAGISVITGEIGCGKTTLVHRLLDQLSQTHTVALLSNIQQGRGDLLSWVLMGFGQEFAGKSHVELFAQLQDFFIDEYSSGRRIVLIIDEAQNLSTDMLEELRMLSNINAGKDQLLQLILVGQPELKGLLNKPELVQLAQRIGADFHLTPLNREEVHAYIETRLAIAGCERRIFSDRAMDFIAEQSRGVPRVINIIADTALVYAFSAEELVVGVETVRNVVRDKTEFGVFGLASDEKAAKPLPPSKDGGLGAFTAAKDPRERQQQQDRAPSNDSARTAPLDATPATNSAAPAREAPPPRRGAMPEPQAGVTVDARPARQMPVVERKSPEKEESSITGVVITAAGNEASPEAAIRSAGDGRAIIFVPQNDDSQAKEIARRSGAVVAEGAGDLASSKGRLRNAGYRQLKKIAPHIQYVQFLESDQALAPDWLASAEKLMARRPEVAVVEGTAALQGRASKARERANNKRVTDEELEYINGDAALIRASAFEAAGGFRGDIPIGDMADLSVRIRRRGGRIWKSPATMNIEKASKKPSGSWWTRQRRRGFENAFFASLHGGPPERLGVLPTAMTVVVGCVLPILAVALILASAVIAPQLMPALNIGFAAAGGALAGLGFFVLAAIVDAIMSRGRDIPGSLSRTVGAFPAFLGACGYWTQPKG